MKHLVKSQSSKSLLSLFLIGTVIGVLATINRWPEISLADVIVSLKLLNQNFPAATGLIFITLFWLITSIGIPVALLLTVSAGAVFGLAKGLALIFVATGLSCTSGYLAGHTLLRQKILRRFPEHMKAVDRGITEMGHVYLVNLRLLPVIPFSMVNLLMGASSMPHNRFLVISLLSSVVPMIIYVNSGATLTAITSMDEVLSLEVLITIVLLANVPLISRRILQRSLTVSKLKKQSDSNLAKSMADVEPKTYPKEGA